VISPRKLEEVATLVGAQLVEEADAGFPRLRLCPSFDTVKFLDYVATLAGSERGLLVGVLSQLAAANFFVHVPAIRARVLELANADRTPPELPQGHAVASLHDGHASQRLAHDEGLPE